MNDDSIMPFGVHKGKQLANVPAKYLIFIYENGCKMPAELREYILDNMQALKQEIKTK